MSTEQKSGGASVRIDTRTVLTTHGWMTMPAHDEYVSGSLWNYGVYSPSESRLLRGLVRPGWTCIDGGANIGVLTLDMAKAVGPTGRVVSFEPQPGLYRMLRANIAMNEYESFAHARNEALSDTRGTLRCPWFTYGEHNNYGAIALADMERIGKHASSTVEVPVVTLDEAFAGEQVDFIKLDIEGMEPAALRGAAALIARCRPMLFVECDKPASGPDTISLIRSYGYTPLWVITQVCEPPGPFNHPENLFSGQCGFNLLCVLPEHDFDRACLREAHPSDPIGTAPADWIVKIS